MLPTFNETTGILLRAIQFSAVKHRDQRRKDLEKSPYINHPIAVTQMLWEIGGVRDSVTLLAAVLHDTIEDTLTMPSEILEQFGSEVLSVVLEVSDDKSLPKEVRKQKQIDHAAGISTQAKLVKLADKCCNLADILKSPPGDWDLKRKQKYLLWGEEVVKQMRGTNLALEEHFDQILREGKKILAIS